MPVYNGDQYLVNAIESVLAQTFFNFEFIIIDDGSTDNTTRILQDFELKDNRIQIHRESENNGIVMALNKGLSLSKGKYIARMDQDDICLPDRLENQIEDHQWRFHSYPVHQMRGLHSQIPAFLINQHSISNEKEARDYISRVQKSQKLLDQLIDNLKLREDLGIIAPKFDIYNNTKMDMPVEYAVIKSALLNLTKYMAKYCKGNSIRVNSMSPGGILDGQDPVFLNNYNSQCLTKGMLNSKDLSGTLLYLLSDMSKYVNGQNLVIDDGTESIRAVFFHETINGLGLTDLENAEKMAEQKEMILGKEMIFSGNVRMNTYFNNPELIIDGVQEINLDELIGKLEKNAT